MRLKKINFDYDVIVTSQVPYAKLDVCTSSSFRGVKTDRIALDMLDVGWQIY